MSKEPLKIALVTGASRGIGRAIAVDFAKNGIIVVATSRNEKRLIELKEELETYEVDAHYIAADIGIADGTERIYEYISRSGLGVNLLVNNAAIIHPRVSLADFEMSEWEEVVNVNLLGAVRLTKLLLPGMIAQGYGKIINISSIGGRKGASGRSAYRVTKAGLISFTESLAAEVKRAGIDVNCICPGSVLTEGYVEAFGEQSKVSGKMMDPSEIAELCTFLVGSSASAVTGAVIDAFGPSNPLFDS